VRHSIQFKHKRELPLPFDWVVVDEASMVDVPMFAKLLEACGPDTRLLLLGDKDQLASVESGSLLGDLCASAGELNRFNEEERKLINQFLSDPLREAASEAGALPLMGSCITELRKSHRFHAGSGIGRLAKAVLAGQAQDVIELLSDQTHHNEVLWHSDSDSNVWETLMERVLSAYKHYVEEENIAMALQAFNEFRVLTPVREGAQGLYALNARIEEHMHRRYPARVGHREVFYLNRPLLVTRNDYDLGLFNGDVGLVRPDPAHNGQLRVWFEGNEEGSGLRSFHPSAINACETAFAMTIHKSQGSEFDHICVVLPEQEESRILTRELLYTGITRARKQVVVWGSEAVLRTSVERSIQRISGLANRLK
jgi:exodeoxyribonuclease V alpha subunit